MQAVTLNFQTGAIQVKNVPTPRLDGAKILVANEHSLISAGTEGYIVRMARKGPIGKALDRPDLAKQVLTKAKLEGIFNTYQVVKNLISSPLPLGYSCAGTVIEVGPRVDLFRPGDRVACAGLGIANHAEHIVVPVTMAAKLPGNVSTASAAFGTLGAIALHGIRLANPELGQVIVVIGLGLLGQLASQILLSAGCRVIGFDLDPRKVSLAKSLGMQAGSPINSANIHELVLAHTGGHGADAVIVAAHSKSNDPINTAAMLVREKGCIIALGLINLDLPRRTFFEKEIRLEVSRAYGAGAYDADYEQKGKDYPFSYVRWTEGRNLETFIDLLSQEKIETDPLVTHRFPLEKAQEAYQLVLEENKQEFQIGVLLNYAAPQQATPSICLRDKSYISLPSDLTFGIIGAGRFAQGILLPTLAKQNGVKFKAVATSKGLSATHVGKKYKCDTSSTDYTKILERPDIGSVLIATRHESHAEIICAAMRAQKNIFVEKPLAINEEQLNLILNVLPSYRGLLHVGFNRRFSPLCQEFSSRLTNRKQPLALTFRFLTPRIIKGHESEWVHDPESGGNRIVGEVCHMVDTALFLVNSPPKTVFATCISGDASGLTNYDTLHVVIKFKDGSIAQLSYLANSDVSVPQERIELFWEGAYGLIDNFQKGLFTRGGHKQKLGAWNQQKGWKEEIFQFIEALKKGEKSLIPIETIIDTTRSTLAIQNSLERGTIIEL